MVIDFLRSPTKLLVTCSTPYQPRSTWPPTSKWSPSEVSATMYSISSHRLIYCASVKLFSFLFYSPIAELQHVASIYGYQPVKVYTHRDMQVLPPTCVIVSCDFTDDIILGFVHWSSRTAWSGCIQGYV